MKMLQQKRRLHRVEEMSRHFQELFILTGYRYPRSTALECAWSVFELNNETVNFWTHFFPTVYFTWCMIDLWGRFDLGNDPYTTPMILYLLSTCLFPAMSAIAHVFNAMSDHARHFCFFVDYFALSWYSFGVAVVYKVYAFPDSLLKSTFADLFIPLAFINALGCMVMSCQSRFMEAGICRKVFRFLAFAVPYWFDSIPIMYRILFCSPVECTASSMFYHIRQFIFAGTSAVLYASHMPERLWPGKFDIFGHSHQLFHVLSILGARYQMIALSYDVPNRRVELESMKHAPGSATCIGLMVALALLDGLILLFYTWKLHGTLMPGERKENGVKTYKVNGEKPGLECNGNVHVMNGVETNGQCSIDKDPVAAPVEHKPKLS